jgi:hypothetical protein
MSIETIEVPFHEGRVCYLTDATDGCRATVECYGDRKAFRFLYDRRRPLHVGDWVRFRGKIRVNTRINRDGKPEEKTQYYHEPYDGSPRLQWAFHEMEEETEAQIVAPPDVLRVLKETMIHIRRHVDSWSANLSAASLRDTVNYIEMARLMIDHELKKQTALEADRNVKVEAIDISI